MTAAQDRKHVSLCLIHLLLYNRMRRDIAYPPLFFKRWYYIKTLFTLLKMSHIDSIDLYQ